MRLKRSKPIALVLSGVFLLPFAFFLFLSLAADWRYPALLPVHFSFASWTLLFSAQSDLLDSFFVSLTIAGCVAFISTLSGFFCSKYIAYHRYKSLLLSFSYGAYILSPVIYAAIIYYFFILLNLTATVTGVVIGQLIIIFPFAVIFFSSFWNKHLKNLSQLVTTLGGTRLQQYTKVLYPLSKNILLVCFFQTFLISWFEYGLTSFIGAGRIITLTLRVFEYVQEANPYYAALSSFLLVMPPVILLWANKKFIFEDNKLLNYD